MLGGRQRTRFLSHTAFLPTAAVRLFSKLISNYSKYLHCSESDPQLVTSDPALQLLKPTGLELKQPGFWEQGNIITLNHFTAKGSALSDEEGSGQQGNFFEV